MIQQPSADEHPQRLPDDLFRVVFVCTGNRARSPLAAALFRRHAARLAVDATSVGTMNVEGMPALPEAVTAGGRLGVDLSQHRSRALDASDLSTADLILGFEPMHVSVSVVEGRAHIGRTFLLGELVTLLESGGGRNTDPVTRARSRVSFADSRRIRSRPDPAFAIVDPLGMSGRAVNRLAAGIDDLVRALVAALFGLPQAGTARKGLRLR